MSEQTVSKLRSLASFKTPLPELTPALKIAAVAYKPLQITEVRFNGSSYGPFAICKCIMLDTGEQFELLVSARIPFEALQGADAAKAFPLTCKFFKPEGKRYWDIAELEPGDTLPF